MSATINVPNGQNTDWGRTPMATPGSVRPVDQKFPPAVAVATGLGAGGGAMVQNYGADADAACGLVNLEVGLSPSASGSISLAFPLSIPAGAGGMVCFADWATLVVTQANPLVIAWTATRTLIPRENVFIAYQWRLPV